MWFLKSFILLLLIVVFLYVAVLNMNQSVTLFLTRPGVPTFIGVPLPLALLGAYVLGVITWFLVSVYQTLAHQIEVGRLKKRNDELLKELSDLRNMPLEDLDTDHLDLPDAGKDPG